MRYIMSYIITHILFTLILIGVFFIAVVILLAHFFNWLLEWE